MDKQASIDAGSEKKADESEQKAEEEKPGGGEEVGREASCESKLNGPSCEQMIAKGKSEQAEKS